MTTPRRLHAVPTAHNGPSAKIAPTPVESPLRDLLESWTIHLRAERKSPNTLAAYTQAVDLFLRWCALEELPPRLDRRTVSAWVAQLCDDNEATTARLRLVALRQFSAWLTEEDELPKDEIRTLKAPKVDQRVVPALSNDEAAALVKACVGRTFLDRRDEAMVRLMLDTTARAGEVVAMELDRVDVARGSLHIVRGKGGKGRVVPFGPVAGAAVDRYLRARRSHPLAGSPALWLSATRNRPLSYSGLRESLAARARAAGIEDFHPHRLRHTAATRWLDAGGSEGGLMAMGGWSRRDLIETYTRDSAERRAAEEFRRLGLGEH
ncbi:MAG: tyrosine-type recombinase/integrase [Sporichthyaceae bacterium]